VTGPLPIEPAERVHQVVTPEGVPIRLTVAGAGDRLGALLLDVLVIVVAIVVLGLGLAFGGAFAAADADLVLSLAWLAIFFLWTFYFPIFELAWQGQTPGKRVVKIRAVDARGGPLTAEAVIARNLTRELEILLPAMAVFSPGALFPGGPGWFALVPLGWMIALGFLPLFNRDRLRVGDIVAGTVVIRLPEAVLYADLSSRAPAAYAFSEEQLDVYGVYELQVLEGVLRGSGAAGHPDAVRTVAEKIRQKIGWSGPVASDEAFLQAFYAAQRGRLERRMLFGKRRRSKHDRQ
jgi:uncharacterized RDD family membrane protein YckC